MEAIPAKKAANQIAGPCLRQLEQQARWDREGGSPIPKIDAGKFFQQPGCFRKSRTRHRKLARKRRIANLQGGHYFGAQVIAGEANVAIAFVFNPTQSVESGIGRKIISRQAQQRPQDTPVTFRHSGGSADARTPQKVEQQCLCLVVGMLREKNPSFGAVQQRRPPRLSRCQFDALTRFGNDADALNVQGYFKLSTCGATEISPPIGIRTQAMVDVDGLDRRPGSASHAIGCMEQYHGIHATGKGDRDALRWKDMPYQACLDGAQHRFNAGLVP